MCGFDFFNCRNYNSYIRFKQFYPCNSKAISIQPTKKPTTHLLHANFFNPSISFLPFFNKKNFQKFLKDNDLLHYRGNIRFRPDDGRDDSTIKNSSIFVAI
jgi:hypothetical protein